MVSGNVVASKAQAPVDFTTLSESEQRQVAQRLIKIEESNWKPFWCPDKSCSGDPHPLLDDQGAMTLVSPHEVSTPARPISEEPDPDLGSRFLLDPKWHHNHARVDQRLPPWGKKWTLFIMSGRGSGKTRTGIEFVTLNARRGLDGAIVGRRGTELENTHVAEILKYAHPEFTPVYLASKDILVWPEVTMPDGTKRKPTTYLFSAERPENIRSVNLSYCWFDEAAWMDEIEKAWPNAKFATRVRDPKNPIHFLITSTPTATKWTMKMEDDPDVEVRRVSTYANRANLSKDFIEDLEKEYEGTRLGRQEIHGEVLRDVEGALWNDDMFKHWRATDPGEFEAVLDSMDNRVLAVDPAGSKGPKSDATGLIVCGVQYTDDDGSYLPASRFYVLADATIKGSPTEWAAQTYKVARQMRVSRIVVERNFGADMVKQTLRDYAKSHPELSTDENGEDYLIEEVHAEKSKETRAEPTVGKYEQGRVTHVISGGVFGDLSMLEKEQTMWVPKSRGGRSPSPNRVDALVWAVRALESKVKFAASMSSHSEIQSMLNKSSQHTAPSLSQPVVIPAMPQARVREPARTAAPVPVRAGDGVAPVKKFPIKLPPIRRR